MAKKKRKTYHLTYTEDSKKWKVELEGANRASSVHENKENALESARELARKQQPSQLIVHKRDGTIQTEYTYEDDPKPPAD